MTTRASSRLRQGQVKAEAPPSTSTLTNTSANTTLPTLSRNNSSNSLRRSTRASTQQQQHTSTIVKNEDGELDEQTLKRLTLEADTLRQALASEQQASLKPVGGKKKRNRVIKEEPNPSGQDSKPASATTTIKTSKYATKEPVGWKTTLDRIREFRIHHDAPVDTMGCERLAEVGDHIPPEVSRFQTLMALVLSSQTKDTVTSVAVRRLQRELKGGLTIEGVLNVSNEKLNSIIGAVGFHNKKTIYMKQVAEICRTQYKGDIPDTAEGLIALPGVGPKM
ncbi:DNA N-glycosylase and apurinic/apyrimidinic (AP) lyase, partial [Podila epigama]